MRALDPSLEEGVYAALPGPHYETPAEIRMLRGLGADLVGMSTALEAIAARAEGVEVLGVSLVTNLAAGITGQPLDHAEVLEAGAASAARRRRAARRRWWPGCDRPALAAEVARAWAEDDPDPATRDEVAGAAGRRATAAAAPLRRPAGVRHRRPARAACAPGPPA